MPNQRKKEKRKCHHLHKRAQYIARVFSFSFFFFTLSQNERKKERIKAIIDDNHRTMSHPVNTTPLLSGVQTALPGNTPSGTLLTRVTAPEVTSRTKRACITHISKVVFLSFFFKKREIVDGY